MESSAVSSNLADTSQPSNVQPNPSKPKSNRIPKSVSVDNVAKKFLKNFDPEQSEREKRKLQRRTYLGNRKHLLYDYKGCFMQTGQDLCDCLQEDCLGCHFACPKCSSKKCGHECRNFRKWSYEIIENEGSDVVIKNPNLKES
ncbi:ARL14 effector protein [Cephus cinctus]|uniref:ARL14 effector protein n=1 Tax=Cephus cinctus TaxID=211228 RepID=A0AAJ7FDV5_CEPCN|nr:ARL14 effector protein [Cephus cinctus]